METANGTSEVVGPSDAAGASLDRPSAARLLELKEREKELTSTLSDLHAKALTLVQSHLTGLYDVTEQQKVFQRDAQQLQATLQFVHETSEKLSSRVRRLDTVRSRIEAALQLVEDLLDLKNCAEGVESAMGRGDYETAAKHIAKYRSLAQQFRQGGDASALEDSSAVLQSLKASEKALTQMVRDQFDKAITNRDKTGVSRYAKLFYPLGLEREGINRYITFIRSFLSDQASIEFKTLLDPFGKSKELRAQQSGQPHAECLMKVFILIADIIQEHQQNIEEEFGSENFILFLRGLQEEADVQGTKVLDKFVQNKASVLRLKADDAASSTMDVRPMDLVLEELALLSQRCQQFDRYLRDCSHNVLDTLNPQSNLMKEIRDGTTSGSGRQFSEDDGLAVLSGLTKRMQEVMNFYVSLEQTFMIKSVRFALHESDEVAWDDPDQMTSTFVDDVFFILRKCITRGISSGDVFAVCAVVNHVTATLSTDVKAVLQENLQESKRLYQQYTSDVSHLTAFDAKEMIPPDPPMVKKDQAGQPIKPLGAAYSWTHSVNNLQACCEYLERLKGQCEAEFDEIFGGATRPVEGELSPAHAAAGAGAGAGGGVGSPGKRRADSSSNSGKVMFHHCLQGLESVKADLESLHQKAATVTLNMLKVHLSPMLLPLDSLDFNISQTEYADFQVNDPFMKGFLQQLDVIHQHVQRQYTPPTVSLIMASLVDQICKRLEALVLAKQFSLFGALQLDQDIRSLMAYCTAISDQSIRHKFGRLSEMGSLLNLETLAEFEDLWSPSSGRSWRLSPDEIYQVLSLRVDFPPRELSKIQVVLVGPAAM
ncbi:unnamed protein product [Vitrella brassicaformis CCMP3155]|uniref:Conserved oligomeric Golgi complex subunit 4 n=1 Tax=Vitrella brassicaformis (strain CCMP3155) TaxID=1169540 RepID=A0A0G4F532_VITBC|nr:unnamed protein product [Vitrella brassicaformis CCMP3155]|eukprot:CEM07052.1 unnamed protein product [Vitrella brassicaformis CCMP3155]